MNSPSVVLEELEELKAKFLAKYGGMSIQDLDMAGSEMLIRIFELEAEFKEATIDEWRFNRYHKPVIDRKISNVKNHIARIG